MGRWLIVSLVLACSIAHAQEPPDINNLFTQSLGSINQCYHGMSTPTPCTTNSWVVAGAVYGRWQAEKVPWFIEFTPNWDIRSGTIVLWTTGPRSRGSYRIEPATGGEFPTLSIDLDNGRHFRASIAFYGMSELLLMDDQGTTTFHRL